ncbi:MAG: GNAT family N-acetyltransferase [Gammaproteobacteria bacterium]|nr:GNAT family N-acetyltransferase [Gammaproteobacteria bacterium]
MSPQHPDLAWHWKSFAELSTRELYALLQLRAEIFVVEQACAYQDLDGRDPACMHLLGWAGERLVAYLRVVPPEASAFGLPSFGRVVSAGDCRGLGLGRAAVRLAVDYLQQAYPGQTLHISAQAYLRDFYAGFGFVEVGEAYLEDGIPHRGMELAAAP